MESFLLRIDELRDPNNKTRLIEEIYDNGQGFDKDEEGTRTRVNSRLLVFKAGWLKNQGKRNTKETSLAKWISCDAALMLQMMLCKSTGLMVIPMNIQLSAFCGTLKLR